MSRVLAGSAAGLVALVLAAATGAPVLADGDRRVGAELKAAERAAMRQSRRIGGPPPSAAQIGLEGDLHRLDQRLRGSISPRSGRLRSDLRRLDREVERLPEPSGPEGSGAAPPLAIGSSTRIRSFAVPSTDLRLDDLAPETEADSAPGDPAPGG